MLECILKTWFGVFCSRQIPWSQTVLSYILVSTELHLYTLQINSLLKKKILWKSAGYTRNCIPIVLQTKKSYFSIWCHLTNSIFILKMSSFDWVSTMMYQQTFQTQWYLLGFTFKWVWLDSYLKIEFKIRLQFDYFSYNVYDVCHQFTYNTLLFPVTTDYPFKMHYTCSVSRRFVKTVFGSND